MCGIWRTEQNVYGISVVVVDSSFSGRESRIQDDVVPMTASLDEIGSVEANRPEVNSPEVASRAGRVRSR